MSIAELEPQRQLLSERLGPEAYSSGSAPCAETDPHDATPYWAQRFAEDPAAAQTAWLEQVGGLPVDGTGIDPVAIYQQAFAQTRANRASWRVWRRRRPGEPDQEVVDVLATSAASLSIMQEAVTIDETTVTE